MSNNPELSLRYLTEDIFLLRLRRSHYSPPVLRVSYRTALLRPEGGARQPAQGTSLKWLLAALRGSELKSIPSNQFKFPLDGVCSITLELDFSFMHFDAKGGEVRFHVCKIIVR